MKNLLQSLQQQYSWIQPQVELHIKREKSSSPTEELTREKSSSPAEEPMREKYSSATEELTREKCSSPAVEPVRETSILLTDELDLSTVLNGRIQQLMIQKMTLLKICRSLKQRCQRLQGKLLCMKLKAEAKAMKRNVGHGVLGKKPISWMDSEIFGI